MSVSASQCGVGERASGVGERATAPPAAPCGDAESMPATKSVSAMRRAHLRRRSSSSSRVGASLRGIASHNWWATFAAYQSAASGHAQNVWYDQVASNMFSHRSALLLYQKEKNQINNFHSCTIYATTSYVQQPLYC